MFRRYIALVSLLGYLAGQLAMVPHAHGAYSASDQRQHAASPHIHVGGHGHGHSHRHDHHHSTPQSDQQPLGDCGTGLDHDADAIYLPPASASLEMTWNERTSAGSAVLLHCLPAEIGCSVETPSLSVAVHPPDRFPPGGRLFLTLRKLRI